MPNTSSGLTGTASLLLSSRGYAVPKLASSLVIGGVDGAHERTEYDTCGSSRVQDVQAGFVAGFDDEPLASDSGLRNVQKQSLRALQVPQFGLADLSSVKFPPHRLQLSTTASRVVVTAPKYNRKAFETL